MIKPDNTKIRKKFGENLRNLRKSRGYSQMKFAEIIGTTQAAVSSWEVGIREPEFSVIFDIAAKFRVPVTTLIPIEASGMAEDVSQKMLDLFSQNPKLCATFEKTKFFDEKQLSVVVSVIEAIAKETERDEA